MELTSELKVLWNMRVTVILIVAGALGTVRKGGLTTGNQRKNRDHPLAKNI